MALSTECAGGKRNGIRIKEKELNLKIIIDETLVPDIS